MLMFDEFMKERQYLQNVSPRTLEWYKQSFRWLGIEKPTESELKEFVIRMRTAGLKPSSCNNRIRAVNAYLSWSKSEHRVPKLKEDQRILPTYATDDIRKFMAWKPVGKFQVRLQCLILVFADTGCRLSEALELKWTDVDFDNLLMKLHGKGGKDRIIPFSMELRKFLFRMRMRSEHTYAFSTRNGRKLGSRNVLRDVTKLCQRLGIRAPERLVHALRHTFAINYLRNGGSVFHLQKVLGHSSLEMTRKYVNLMTDDLQKVHQQVSMLSV
jgi:integrase/recombinase XerD